MIASQFAPESLGVSTRWFRLAPNPTAAESARRLSAAPNIAVRTGTAVRPRPGSSAIRTPVAALAGSVDLMRRPTADDLDLPRASIVPSALPPATDPNPAAIAPL